MDEQHQPSPWLHSGAELVGYGPPAWLAFVEEADARLHGVEHDRDGVFRPCSQGLT